MSVMSKLYLFVSKLEFEMENIKGTDVQSTVAEENAEADAYAGQLLDGARAIRRYLVHLGFDQMTEKRVFHWAADGRLPVKKVGNRLVANKRALLRHFGIEAG